MPFYHDPSKGERPHVVSCRLFGGRSPLTGKGVGERHRWSQGKGKGQCEFCGRFLDEVTTQPMPPDIAKAGVDGPSWPFPTNF